MKTIPRGILALVIAAVVFMAAGLPALAQAPAVAISPSSSTGLSPVASAALESSHVLKAAPGNLYDFQANFGTCASAPCWVMLFNATSLPANGVVAPVKWWQVSANTTLITNWAPGPPLYLNTGITVGCSTTGPFTLTATAQCAISGEVQ